MADIAFDSFGRIEDSRLRLDFCRQQDDHKNWCVVMRDKRGKREDQIIVISLDTLRTTHEELGKIIRERGEN